MDITTIVSFGGYIISGILAVIGIFNYQARSRRQEDDLTATNLINNLKTTTELQERELVSLRLKEVEQGKEIAHLQGQVKVLSDIFQGRDPAVQAFIAKAPELLAIANENNGYAKKNFEATSKLTDAITELVKQMASQVK